MKNRKKKRKRKKKNKFRINNKIKKILKQKEIRKHPKVKKVGQCLGGFHLQIYLNGKCHLNGIYLWWLSENARKNFLL